jgi:hypothetical protein
MGIRIAILTVIFVFAATAAAADVHIRVDAHQVIGPISPYTTGACIEDVNHEVYGGIYSQMIFGESFQEPATAAPPRGFKAYGGRWTVKDGELHADGADGPKLVADNLTVARGEVSVEVFFPDDAPGNAGVIVAVNNAGVGADRFNGYEISLSPRSHVLVLARHRHNW